MGKSCVLVPKVKRADGTEVESKLYNDLKKHPALKGNRPLINYIYAQYLSNGEAALDAAGMTRRDSNGQHIMQDVYSFYDIANILNTVANPSEVTKAKENAGAVDSSGNIIYYDNGIEALNKVKDFNDNNKAFVARLVRDGDKYIIQVEERNALTHDQIVKAEEQLKLIETVKHTFNGVGIDIEKIILENPGLFNISDITNSVNYLKALQKTNLGLISQKEIRFLLSTLPDTSIKLQRILTKWGDLDNASRVMYEHFRGVNTLSSGEEALVIATLDIARKFNGLNITKLQFDLERESLLNTASIASKISEVLKELKNKYKLDNKNTITLGKEIKSLQQAAANAAMLLDKRLKELEKKQGLTLETKQLQKAINTLLKEIDSNRYYQGMLVFLKETAQHITEVQTALSSIEGTPGSQEYIANYASVLLEAKNIIKGYKPLIEQLKSAENFSREEGITSENLNNITDKASTLSTIITKLEKEVADNDKAVIMSILSDWMGWGDSLPNGKTIANLLGAIDDVSMLEYLYSTCRSSNPLLAALGTIVREAQDKRNNYIIEYNNRISRATDKLKQATGSLNTKWMYDSEGRIINPYDWEKFSEEYKKICKELKQADLKGFDFKMALQERIKNELTEEVVVDIKSGRTERMPIFRKDENPLDKLTDVQLEYYNEIMQIKGEFGTMMPNNAQNHFLPPQVRSNSLWDSKGWKDFFKRIGSNIADIFRITEEDIDMAGNLTFVDIEDEQAVVAESDYSDEPLKEIPVYHVRKLKDQSKLITDFSGALQIMGASAINYKCLSAIESSTLLISDYIQGQEVIERDSKGIAKIFKTQGVKTNLIKRIFKHLKSTNVATIAESYLERELYGIKLKDNYPRIAKFVQSVLNYTRFRQLSTNVLGGTANLLTGEYQIILEAIGNEYFNLENYAWACAKLFGDNITQAPGKFMDFISNNTNELSTLIGNFFDPLNDSFQELGHKRYNGVVRNIFTYDYDGLTYGIGENIIHQTVMYSMLHNEKIFINGEETYLFKAFEKGLKQDGTTELKIKDNVQLAERDSDGNLIPGRKLENLEDEYFANFRGRIRSANQECHGAMSQEDRGVISQRLVGRAAMQFRQWMVEAYSKRYREFHWDGSSKQFTEGWWHTVYKTLKNEEEEQLKFFKRIPHKLNKLKEEISQYEQQLQNNSLDDKTLQSLEQKLKFAKRQQKNIKAAIAEISAVALLNIISVIMWMDDDEDNPFWRFIMYCIKRLTWDATAISPFGVPTEAISIVSRPAASVSTLSGMTYPLLGLINGDVIEDFESGPHKGENKYLINTARLLPVYKDVEKMEKLLDENHKRWGDLVTPFQYGKKYY